MSLYKNFASVGAMTFLSRILGFLRDMLIASLLGTSMAADAFFAAFRFPNLFRRLFAEGAFNTAFIPMFSAALEEHGEAAARDLAARIISWLLAVLVLVLAGAEIFMPNIMGLFVPGFLSDPDKFDFTILLARICFPYLALMSLMAAFGGMLNGLRKFLAAAFAPVMLNVVLIVVLAILVLLSYDAAGGAIIMAAGVLIGGVAQVAIVTWALARIGLLPSLRFPVWDRDIARFGTLALPVVLAGGITQINIFIGTIIASGAPGAVSFLNYADRMYQLPLGIIGVAIGVVLLPELTRHLKGNRLEKARTAQEKSLLMAMLLGLPAAVALFVLAHPIIQVLFQRGAFDARATGATAAALSAFAIGLPAFLLIKVFQPGFFARQNTVVPTLLAALSVAINITVSLLLFPRLAHVGIAVATTVSAWFNALMLLAVLVNNRQFSFRPSMARDHLFVVLASILMGFALWGGQGFLPGSPSGNTSLFIRIGAFGLLLVAGLVIYFVQLFLYGLFSPREFISLVFSAPAPEHHDP